MDAAYEFLKALAVVLGVAAVTTLLFQKLKQPVVLGYILAGLIIGPHVPIPIVADPAIVRTLSELGVILLMFSLGLEFRLGTLVKLAPTAGLTALFQSSLMVWLGFLAGRIMGWTSLESVFCGAILAISSTTIIAKAFDEQKIRGRLRELVVGILIVEDFVAIVIMAILTAVATGAGLSAGGLAEVLARLGGFLVGLMIVGLLVVPRAIRGIVRMRSSETTLVSSIAICFGIAVLAHAFGYSVALGAFIAGSLIAESGEGEAIEHLVRPVRDIFAAVFFVSVGMLFDPALVARHWVAVVVLTLLVTVGKIFGVTLGAFLTGNGTRASIAAGMSLAQIGEFSFIIAGLGLSLGATRDFIYPVAVGVSAITTLTTPWLIRGSGAAARFVDRKLPRPLQTFASLYGSWLEGVRTRPRGGTRLRRLVVNLLVDAAVLTVLAIVVAIFRETLAVSITRATGLDDAIAEIAVIAGAVALAVPFLLGIYGLSRKLGVTLAELALPTVTGTADLATTPRRALVVALQLACLLAAGAPVVAVTAPFLPGAYAVIPLVLGALFLSVALWRNATELHGHVRAGAEMIVEALAAGTGGTPGDELSEVHRILPGIGEPEPLRLGADSAAVGKSLAELNLRGATGATVLAITRKGAGVSVPSAGEVLQAGDVLALAGSAEAIAAARTLLLESAPRA